MSASIVPVPELLEFWDRERTRYADPVFALVLATNEVGLDSLVTAYISDNAVTLDHMSGSYCLLTVLDADPATEGNTSVRRPARLEYVHRLDRAAIGGWTVYDIAHGLTLDLDQLPAVVVSTDPWAAAEYVVYSIRRFVTALVDANGVSMDEAVVQFFRSVFTASREVYEKPIAKRRAALRRTFKRHLHGVEPSLLDRAVQSGFFAQVIEGVIKGLKPPT
jgi:hypothetical protein